MNFIFEAKNLPQNALKIPLNLKIIYVLFLSHFPRKSPKHNVPERFAILPSKIELTDFEPKIKTKPSQKLHVVPALAGHKGPVRDPQWSGDTLCGRRGSKSRFPPSQTAL